MKNANIISRKLPARIKSLKKIPVVSQKIDTNITRLQDALVYAEAIVTTIPTPLLILYPAFKIRTANKAFYKTFKVSPTETEGKMIYNLGNGQWNIPILKKLLEEILPKKNELQDFEVEHCFEDIGNKIMLLNARRLHVDHQEDQMIFLSIEDITEERSIERAVEKERKIVLENIPSGLMILDKEWRLTYCNKKTETIIGKKIINIAGRNIWKVLPELVDSPFDTYCCKAMKSGKPVSFEQLFTHLNAWFRIQAFSSTEGLSIYFDDITKHKKAEEIIEFERQKMYNLFMNAPAQISVFRGREHIYELANKPYMKMVGSKRDLIGVPIRKAVPEFKEQGIFDILDNVYKTSDPYIGKEMHIKLNDDVSGKKEDKILNFVFQPYTDSNGEVEGIISYASDITSLENKRKHIEQLLKQKDEFISVASHELKTPVTSIKGYTQILQMRFAQEGNTKAVDLLVRMDGQINKLNNLISDLLDVTKIEGGKLQYHESSFDFNELVAEIVEEMQQISQRHTIIIKPVAAFNAKTYGDRDRIGQVMTNFISNATKYSPNKSKVVVAVTNVKNCICFSVQDFGIGIPKLKQNKVFERFYRVSGNKENTFPGMGLGLFIASEIIKRHQGEISFKSASGKGSTFYFNLPVKSHK